MPSSALAICAREKTACESAQTRPGDFGRLVWGGGAGSGGVRFGLSVAGGILAAPPVGTFRLSIPVPNMGLSRVGAVVGVVGLFFPPARRTKCSPLRVTMEPQTATVGSQLGFRSVPFSFFGGTAGVWGGTWGEPQTVHGRLMIWLGHK